MLLFLVLMSRSCVLSSAGDKPGGLGRHYVLRAGRAFILGLGLLRCAYRCEYNNLRAY